MWKIGQLAQRSGCSIETIRYYEQRQLLPKPSRSVGNFRLYDATHLQQLQFIRHCRSLDIRLEEIRQLLRYRQQPEQECGEINQLLDQHIEQVRLRISALHELQQQLLCLRAQCSGVRSAAACGILRGLAEAGGCQLSAEAQEQPPDTTSRGGG